MSSIYVRAVPNITALSTSPPCFPSSQMFSLPFAPTPVPNAAKTHKPLETLKDPRPHLHQISSLCRRGLLREAFALLSQLDSRRLPVPPAAFADLLQCCLHQRALSEGRQIHARIVKHSIYRNGDSDTHGEYLETKILIFYAKCGCVSAAEEMFRRLRGPRRNVFSWAAVIGLRSRHGLANEALLGFVEMIESGDLPDNFIIPNALKACSSLGSIGLGKAVHGCALKSGYASCVYVLSSLVDFYGKCGVLDDARKVFEDMPERNVVTWNSMLVGLVQNGMDIQALETFVAMRVDGVEPTRVSIASVMSASANLLALEEGRQGHAVALLHGLELDNILGSSIVNFYCKVGLVEDAEIVFDRIPDKDVVTWNLLISGLVQDGQIEKALHTCCRMRKQNLKYDSVTLSSIISACAGSGKIELGRAGHGFCIRNNFVSDLVIATSIIDLYASCGRMECAQLIFDTTSSRDLVLWNALISAYAQHGRSGEALKLFYRMQLEGVPPNAISWNSVILGFLRDGQISEAKEMFSQMQINGVDPNLITWTTIISGLAQNGCGQEAIRFFEQMQCVGIRPGPITIIGMLLACTNAASLKYGSAAHGHIVRHGLESSVWFATSLVDMYAKCGSVQLAMKVFETVSNKEQPLYNAMISGMSLHGRAEEALALYRRMCEEGLEPDSTTFTGLLTACSHAGLVIEGLKVLAEMVSKYKLLPQKEHYGCVTTLLARFGSINEALRLISTLPLNADPHIVSSLLAACKEHREIELGEYLSSHLLKLEPTNLTNYVTLANLYATSGRWQRASKVRSLMREIGPAKDPGCSWIQVGHELHTFLAGDKSHSRIDVISDTLHCLHNEMRLADRTRFCCFPVE